MNILSRDKQIDIIAALTEGMSIRAVERRSRSRQPIPPRRHRIGGGGSG